MRAECASDGFSRLRRTIFLFLFLFFFRKVWEILLDNKGVLNVSGYVPKGTCWKGLNCVQYEHAHANYESLIYYFSEI
jgi:hypothetical protein